MAAGCRSWLEIDTAAIAENLRSMRRRHNGIAAMAMVKANAYGLGAVPIARAVAASGAACRLGVSSLAEALEISDVGMPIQIISSLLPDEIPDAVRCGFILPLFSLEAAKLISAEACRQQRQVHCELKADTGMGRLGFRYEKLPAVLPELTALPGLQIRGIFSHFPAADTPADPETDAQIQRFKTLISECLRRGMVFDRCHMAATDAVCHYPAAAAEPFNLIRPGIGLYGFADGMPPEDQLAPAVAFKTVLADIRELPAGASVGYGRTFKLQQNSRIGIVAAGYADGIPTALANRGTFMIKDVKVPIAGRVSMDYTAVLLPPEVNARPGDEVLCFGGTALPMTEWAALKGTIPYEILCSIGRRVVRKYLP